MNEILKPFKYDQVADFYDEIELDANLNNALIKGLITVLNNLNCLTVWDAACGTGAQAIHLHLANFTVFATDLSEKMIQKAREKTEKISFNQGDMRSYKLPVKVDAVIVMMNSLSHLSTNEVREALRNFYDNLKSGGYLIADFDNKNFLEQHVKNEFFVSRVCFIQGDKYMRLTKAEKMVGGVYQINDQWQKNGQEFFRQICEVQSWSADEMADLLDEANFSPVEWRNRYFQQIVESTKAKSDSLLFVAKKN